MRLLLMTFYLEDGNRHAQLLAALRSYRFAEINKTAVLIELEELPAPQIRKEIWRSAGLTDDDSVAFFDVTDSRVYPAGGQIAQLVRDWRLRNKKVPSRYS